MNEYNGVVINVMLKRIQKEGKKDEFIHSRAATAK